MTNNNETITVDLGDRSYPIHIGEGLFESAADYIPLDLASRKIFVLADDNTAQHAETLVKALQNKAHSIQVNIIPEGESSKSYDMLQDVLGWLLTHKVDRSSVLIACGGGVIGDLGGFAASIVLRGIAFVQAPTSLLAMVDSSVGGKTGINTAQGKNLVGSFYQPISVIADTNTLQTLPEREMKAGYAEIVKYGLINKPDFFTWLEAHGKSIVKLNAENVREAIATSCNAKADIVAQDEKESGARALLNLGHTFGHALEAGAGYDGTLLHGEGVAIGMILAHSLSARMGLCSNDDVQKVKTHLDAIGLPTHITLQTNAETLMESMTHDKKMKNGKLTFVLTKGIGKAFLTDDVKPEDVKAVIEEGLKQS